MDWIILVCLFLFANEQLYKLNWYDTKKRMASKLIGAGVSILAMTAVVGQIMIMLR